jgi:hypothetical protein
MTTEARVTALTAENEALHAQIARLREEDGRMRTGLVTARHHLAMALRALNLDAEAIPSTERFHNGG